ncbi:uncharacterized protein M6B38_381850 [Iris pallida]|uniref:Uncharacterized protein n=1 Tax=Iris pallida TaxID=29817 RepID=A0AAX6G7B5_IRIPA|nr:Uncharacterized protein M6B38_245270 [Iris pallida]KAJ6824502.1 uncharacterized protein M6B38_381850 [Iris pallida]
MLLWLGVFILVLRDALKNLEERDVNGCFLSRECDKIIECRLSRRSRAFLLGTK